MVGNRSLKGNNWSRSGVAFLIVAVLAIGCYLNALGGEFVSDDHKQILSNPLLIESHRLPEIFTKSFPFHRKQKSGGYYRPITALSYWIDFRLFGPNPFIFHLENLLWHTATALLVLVLLRNLWPTEPKVAFMGAVLFAVHPVHTEAVAWVSGRSEILAAFWGLLAYWAFLRADRKGAPTSLWRIAASAAWLVALGAKEMAATVPLLLFMTEALRGSPSGWWRPGRLFRRYGLFVATAVAYFVVRNAVLGKLVRAKTHPYFFSTPAIGRGATMLKVFAAYVGKLIFPVNLNASWAMSIASGLTDGPLPFLALALLVGLVGLAWTVRRTAPPVAWGILWSGLALLPVSNIMPIGEFAAERFLYFSSVGACVALAWVMTRGAMPRKEGSSQAPGNPMAGALVLAVLVLFSVNTIIRNRDWSNDLVLWDKTVRQSPLSSRAHRNLAKVLWRQGWVDEAEFLFKRTLTIGEEAWGLDGRPVAPSLRNLANFYYKQGRYAEAEPLFRRLLSIGERIMGPDHPDLAGIINNLGAIYFLRGEISKAEPLFRRSLAIWEKSLSPNHPILATGLENLAEIYIAHGKPDEAKRLLERAEQIRASQ